MISGKIKNTIFGSLDDSETGHQKLDSASHSKSENFFRKQINSGNEKNHVSKSDTGSTMKNHSLRIKVPKPYNYNYPDIEKIKNEIKRDLLKRCDDDVASIMSELFENRKSTASIK